MKEAIEATLKHISDQHALMLAVAQKNSADRKWDQVISNIAEIMSLESAHRVATAFQAQLGDLAPKEEKKLKQAK